MHNTWKEENAPVHILNLLRQQINTNSIYTINPESLKEIQQLLSIWNGPGPHKRMVN